MNIESLNGMTREQQKKMLDELQSKLSETTVDWVYTKEIKGTKVPIPHQANTEKLFDHFDVTCKYNEMAKNIEFEGLGQLHRDTQANDALVKVQDMASLQGYSRTEVLSHVGPISRKHAYHPARDWVLSEKWDGTDRLGALIDTIETVEDDQYKTMLMTKWFIAAVALLMYNTDHQSPENRDRGFKGTEGILVFHGRQGLGKTQWIESLVPARSQWIKDAVTLNPHDKDSVLLAVSHWIVELGEIDATFKKSDIAALKGFVTQKLDILRPAYARVADSYERRTAFTGTVNDETFLAEQGESRRWWVLSVEAIHSTKSINMQQLWAQVFSLYAAGTAYWLNEQERAVVSENNGTYEQLDPLVEKLEQFVRDPLTVVRGPKDLQAMKDQAGTERLRAGAIAERLLGRLANKAEANRVAKWLRDKGYQASNKQFRVVIDFDAINSFNETYLKVKWSPNTKL